MPYGRACGESNRHAKWIQDHKALVVSKNIVRSGTMNHKENISRGCPIQVPWIKEELMERKRIRVLAIDDEDFVRDLLYEGLSAKGFEVKVASDGREGQEVMTREVFDVVITDLVMPECEGIETIAALKRRFPRVKVIAMSGATFGTNYLEIARGLGADGALAKPFTVAQVVQTINGTLSA
ncbi:MAG: response regulator [Chitinivibrionales bacterium]|nr:response regulator [Chitinivibrionales bacterium]MBD3358670.1 response regulator [Chitinivibrionales bacterium]